MKKAVAFALSAVTALCVLAPAHAQDANPQLYAEIGYTQLNAKETFGANTLKFAQGGWFPVVLGIGLMLIMWTWTRGAQILTEKTRRDSVPLTDLQTRFIAGHLPDWSGYEYQQPTLNPFITHNLLFDFTLPTAYTGASGIFVIAAGALIYHEVRHAGGSRQFALAASAMSGSLGVVLRPCLLVVLIAGIGFAAYVAIRAFGARHGLLVTALLGGIVSSTAMTITLARLNAPQLRAALAAGLLATSALMFPRVLLEVGIVNPALLPGLSLPLAAAGAIYAAGALFYYLRAASAADSDAEPLLKNPFELGPALRFAALLVLILLLVEGARRWFGDAGIYLVSLLAGLTDVDAITLSLASKARDGLAHEVAARGIVFAALSNSLVKAMLIVLIGGRELALRTLPIMFAGLLTGLALLLLR